MDLSDNVYERGSISDESLISSGLSHPNYATKKFKGQKSTWRKLTKGDTLVHASMTKLQDQDLSVHLYNAHAMKRRHYDLKVAAKLRPWSNKNSWRGDANDEDSDSANFVPPKAWTAWPLNSDVVPRNGEQIGTADEADVWTVRNREARKPSYELEDILVGITLKISKERFEKREWDQCSVSTEAMQEKSTEIGDDLHGAADENISSFSKRLDMGTSENHLFGLTSSMARDSEVAEGPFGHMEEGADKQMIGISLEKGNTKPTTGKACSLEHPTMSADDDRSKLLLRPSIRHTLVRLDEVLSALHHARQTCLHYASDHPESQTEAESGGEPTEEPQSRSHPRMAPSVCTNTSTVSKESKGLWPVQPQDMMHSLASEEEVLPERGGMSEKKKRGRKRHVPVLLEGETQEEMLVRIARSQKRAIPFSSPASFANNSSSAAKVSRDGSRKRGTSIQARCKRSTRLGLRDWSEVIGAATLVGIPPEVIVRSTQRCVNLLGEGMTLRSMVDHPMPGDFEDYTLHYLPWQVPFLDKSSESSLTQTESDEPHVRMEKASAKGNRYHRQASKIFTDHTDLEDIKTGEPINVASRSYRCPYDWCVRSKYAFDRKDRLLGHMKVVHKIQKGELKGALEDNDEEMDRGVHVDGFLKEIRRRKGWRGTDGEQRKRSRKGEITKSDRVSSTLRL